MPQAPLEPEVERDLTACLWAWAAARKGQRPTLRQIAGWYGVHPQTVYNVARRHGLPKRRVVRPRGRSDDAA